MAVKRFASFTVMELATRKTNNPQTIVAIKVPAKKVVKFTPTLNLKKAVEG